MFVPRIRRDRRQTRRDLLRRAVGVALTAPVAVVGRYAAAQPPPLPKLPAVPAGDAVLLTPSDLPFAQYQPAFNLRTELAPQLRAMCKTAQGVAIMLNWCRTNHLPFAIRCGGHSYEGFSQSSSVVIDTRLMSGIAVNAKTSTATVGAGASLGGLYLAIGAQNLAFPGGSCPTVGVSGHALGGGYGYLARPFGLACDNLLSIDLVDPQGHQISADARQNPDLFWACRGGGGGSFGIATSYTIRLQKVTNVLVFSVAWPAFSIKAAADIMNTWQRWAPTAPSTIDSNLVIERNADGTIKLRSSGLSIGTLQELRRELRSLSNSASVVTLTFLQAVRHFAGSWSYPVQRMKGKSDYAVSPISDEGLTTLMSGVSHSTGVYVICDAYGGAIANVAPSATAFAHRAGTLFCLQYGSVWAAAEQTQQRLAEMRQLYGAMRPYVSGEAYVNYCDTDLQDWETAYWGDNLGRLKQIKKSFDPENVFQHAQSVLPV
jgi:FAD/FMN-containing dehydrogenase